MARAAFPSRAHKETAVSAGRWRIYIYINCCYAQLLRLCGQRREIYFVLKYNSPPYRGNKNNRTETLLRPIYIYIYNERGYISEIKPYLIFDAARGNCFAKPSISLAFTITRPEHDKSSVVRRRYTIQARPNQWVVGDGEASRSRIYRCIIERKVLTGPFGPLSDFVSSFFFAAVQCIVLSGDFPLLGPTGRTGVPTPPDGSAYIFRPVLRVCICIYSSHWECIILIRCRVHCSFDYFSRYYSPKPGSRTTLNTF